MEPPTFENGQVCAAFTDDGAGMIYYPSGKAAAVVSVASSYQKRFYFYNNDRDNTMLAAFDEKMVGFATEVKKGVPGQKLILTKDGGKVVDAGGYITRHWKWDPSRQNPGELPTEPIVVQLNPQIKVVFEKQDKCEVKYSCEAFSQTLDCGLKLKRTTCYLDGCSTIKSGPERGKKVFGDERLKTIQQQGEENALAKTQKVHARTTVVTNEEILGVIEGHTAYFEEYKKKHKKP